MDALTYNYIASSNKLNFVADPTPVANYTEDIDAQLTGNYTYDAIGNLKTDVLESITSIIWNVYGKITSIVKSGATISYTYDAAGNRITKTAGGKTTMYVRDASGNVMCVYEAPVGTAALKQIETHLYGSSRLGILGEQTVLPSTVNLTGGFSAATVSTFTRGEKFFEMGNHLGNVLVTISDKKIQHTTNSTVVDYWNADVVTATDYAPFGMQLVGRKFSGSSSYRYGFNGKENDPETNTQDYGMRIYDPRLGRFLSVDPITKDYPELTPYQFASNTPIQAIDLDGLEAYGVYNKASGLLALIPDKSQMKPKLSTKFVSAVEYDKLTTEDKSKSNYGILIKNVFTGGHYDAESKQIVQNDPSRPKEKPISAGEYNILENKGNTNPIHNSFFVLDPVDKSQYDKVDDRPGEINSDGEKRSGYNLHPGQVSWGCVTVCSQDPNLTPEQRQEEWNIVNKAINNTKTESVPDRRGRQKNIPFTKQTKFGTLKVIDTTPVPPAPVPTAPAPSNNQRGGL